jgi:hypothetical protein
MLADLTISFCHVPRASAAVRRYKQWATPSGVPSIPWMAGSAPPLCRYDNDGRGSGDQFEVLMSTPEPGCLNNLASTTTKEFVTRLVFNYGGKVAQTFGEHEDEACIIRGVSAAL